MISSISFPAMGNTAVIQINDAHAHLLEQAKARVLELEGRWSRFEPLSEISLLNAANGAAVPVSADTAFLLNVMQQAFSFTLGLFDPTMLQAIHAVGYTSSLTSNLASSLPQPNIEMSAKPCIHDLAVINLTSPRPEVITPDSNPTIVVTLPQGLTLDPGAIGKGAAADLVAQKLLSAGATDVCVAIGGDVSFAGAPRSIAVLSPFSDDEIAHVAFQRGGVATSSVTAKQLPNGHHVLDPRTQSPISHDVVQATVLASTCAWAEALATACLVAGDTSVADALQIGVLLVKRDGSLVRSARWEDIDA